MPYDGGAPTGLVGVRARVVRGGDASGGLLHRGEDDADRDDRQEHARVLGVVVAVWMRAPAVRTVVAALRPAEQAAAGNGRPTTGRR